MLLVGKTQIEVDKEKNIQNLKNEQNELQKYLDDTDWYVTRKMERNIDLPIEVSTKRLTNITRINEIKDLLK